MLRQQFIWWLSRKLGIPQQFEIYLVDRKTFDSLRADEEGPPRFIDDEAMKCAIWPRPTSHIRIFYTMDEFVSWAPYQRREDDRKEALKFLAECGL